MSANSVKEGQYMVTGKATQQILTLEDYLQNPPDGMEWLDGKLVEKHPLEWVDGELVGQPSMTAKTRRIQAKLTRYWGNYQEFSGQGGEVYVEASCRTLKQARIPDVSYITPELLAQVGEFKVLLQSFPLLAEVLSPTDFADELFVKTQEYLQSGCQEVWLLFPESSLVLVITQSQTFLFKAGEVASTQVVLQGFSVSVDELMA